ncbi:MAG TPA: pyridoxal phosphate-dependent aminotransferase [Gemmatimonadales bacterium]|nr:pyridoxal phosphate-dependent aminotransferase [Gemmatimonadales bacterium]
MSDLSPNLAYLRPSETVAISNETKRRRAAGEDVLDLSVGEPDFDTPRPVAEAGIQAIQKGFTRYPPNIGLPELRAAIGRSLSLMSGGRAINPDQIVVSSGSKQSIFNACFSLFGPKDKVLIPTPAWVSYPQIVHLCRAEPVAVPGDPEWGLKVSARDLEQRTDKLVKGLILCSPCNPTGATYSATEIKAIAEWARANGVWIIADEIYRRIYYGDGPAPSFLDLPDEYLERVVLIYGASKAYAMTGWRIGSAYAPMPVAKAMAALQSHTTTGANHPAQWAAATAFTDERVDQEVTRMVAAFRRRRDRVVSRFRAEAPGVEFVEPTGAFYFFFRVDGVTPGHDFTGTAFCEQAMAAGVAMVPGAAFGDDRWVRMSYALGDKDLDRALDRILGLIARLGGSPAPAARQAPSATPA